MPHERPPGVVPDQKEGPHRAEDRRGLDETMQQVATPPLYTPKRQNSRRNQDRRDTYRYQGKPGGSELLQAVREKIAAAREGSR